MAPSIREVSLFLAAIPCVLALEAPQLCGADLDVLWEEDLSFTPSNATCYLPSASEFADDLLVDRHMHLSGDSALRMPLQHFQAEWQNCKVVGKLPRSTRPQATKLDHKFCSLHYVPFKKLPAWEKAPLPHALGRFALSLDETP